MLSHVLIGTVIVIVIVIVIGGLKSRGLTNTPIVCAGKISPVEIPTIPRLAMLRDVKKAVNCIFMVQIGLIWGFSIP